MIEINVRDARTKLSDLLTEAERGEVISITRRGKEVARIVPPEQPETTALPDFSAFRKTLKINPGAIPTSELIRTMRDKERF